MNTGTDDGTRTHKKFPSEDFKSSAFTFSPHQHMVSVMGVEPTTYRLKGGYSTN